MKKQLQLIFSLLAFTLAVNAQFVFNDDFESYNEGDLIGASSQNWRTWGGQGGGADDVAIVTDRANSGSNSLRLKAVGGGGPGDIVLPFLDKYTSGNFHLDFMVYIPAGSSAYYNFQGESTPGQEWVYNVNMNANGSISFAGGANVTIMAATFSPDTWTKMGIDVDLNNNVWAISVNDECVGSIQNPSNYLASLNLYPTAGNDYYVDDINMMYTPDGDRFTTDAVLALNTYTEIGIVGANVPISGTVTNNGTTAIDGFDISYGGTTESFEEQIESGASASFVMNDVSYAIADGTASGQVTLSNVDGDENSCNDISTIVSLSITVPRGKKYVAEEATGTWCQFCPRGDVFMNYMNDQYPNLFIGIAMHGNGNDPMEIPEYVTGLTELSGFSGFPSVSTERNGFIDPSGLEQDFVTRIQQPSPADITIAATFDESSRELVINASLEALTTIFSGASIVLVLTEDGVTGTGPGYNQANAFSGGSTIMGGYELLPDPVPAAQMVYNHVARALLDGFTGAENAFSGGMSAGDRRSVEYKITLPEEWDEDNIHIVAIFRDSDGTTPTGAKATIEEAVQNVVSSTSNQVSAQNVEVYPNPFAEVTNVTLNLEFAADVTIDITDSFGRLISTRNYGAQEGKMIFPINADNLSAGLYFINVLAGDSFISKRVVINRK